VLRYIDAPIVTVGAGWVASIAVPILLSAEKKNRYCLPNTRFLLHQPSGGVTGQTEDIRIQAEQIIRAKRTLTEILAKHTGQSMEQIQLDSERDKYFSAGEAKEYGLVDEVIVEPEKNRK